MADVQPDHKTRVNYKYCLHFFSNVTTSLFLSLVFIIRCCFMFYVCCFIYFLDKYIYIYINKINIRTQAVIKKNCLVRHKLFCRLFYHIFPSGIYIFCWNTKIKIVINFSYILSYFVKKMQLLFSCCILAWNACETCCWLSVIKHIRTNIYRSNKYNEVTYTNYKVTTEHPLTLEYINYHNTV